LCESVTEVLHNGGIGLLGHGSPAPEPRVRVGERGKAQFRVFSDNAPDGFPAALQVTLGGDLPDRGAVRPGKKDAKPAMGVIREASLYE